MGRVYFTLNSGSKLLMGQPCFIDIVKRLLAIEGRGINPADDNNAALHFAAENGHTDVVDLLLKSADPRIDPTVDECSPIKAAAEEGHFDVVKRFLQEPRLYESTDIEFSDPSNEGIMTEAFVTLIQHGELPHALVRRWPQHILQSQGIQIELERRHLSTVDEIRLLLRSDEFAMIAEDLQIEIIKEVYDNTLFLHRDSEKERTRSICRLVQNINRAIENHTRFQLRSATG